MDSLKVVAVANSEETRALLHKQLQGLNFVSFDEVYLELSDAVNKCQSLQPDVIIVDLTDRELDGGLFIQAIGMNPENPCTIFALHRNMDLDIFKEAVRRGAKEFIQYPDDQENLTVSLKKHKALISRVVTQSVANQESNQQKEKTKGQIIAAFSSKGGSGCSTIATNLAYELQQMGHSTVFFDLDQVYFNSKVSLNLEPEYSLGDLAGNNPKDVDDALIEKITAKHSDSGLRVVVGSKNVLDNNDMISVELLESVLNYLSAKYEYVVIDLPTHVLDPYHQYVVERADTMLLISGSDIPALHRTRQYLDLVQGHLDQSKIKLILNRGNQKAIFGMGNQELEAQFNFDTFMRIPYDWDLHVDAHSAFSPLSRLNHKAETVKAIQKLARMLSGEENQEAVVAKQPDIGGGGLLSKLLGGKGNKQAKGNPANVVQ